MAAPTEEPNSPQDKQSPPQGDKAIEAKDNNTDSANTNTTGDVATQTDATEKAAKKKASKVKHPRRGGGRHNIAAWAAVILFLLVAGGVYVNFQGIKKNSVGDQARDQQQADLRQQLAALRTELSQLQQANEQMQQQAKSADLARQSLTMELERVAKLAADKGKAPVYWRVAEAEYLLKVANHRVILEQDTGTALTALRDADKRLEKEADPGLIPVRQQITAEINSLRAVQQPDIAGTSVRLSELVSDVQTLPLIGFKLDAIQVDAEAAAPKAADWQELPKAMWRDILSLVTIRRREQAIEPMLPPDEQHYLAQNLGLKFEQSRVALLRRDTGVYRRNLTEAREWIQRYFDQESPAVQQVLEQVSQLESTELQPALPDISGSLRSLRAWLASQTQASRIDSGGRG